MSSIKLRELIRQVRLCKTAAEERAVITKECALIRNAFKVRIFIIFVGGASRVQSAEHRQAAIYELVGVSDVVCADGVFEAGGIGKVQRQEDRVHGIVAAVERGLGGADDGDELDQK
jgi:hypothetical protein